MIDQSEAWSGAAEHYEEHFVDPYAAGSQNPLPGALEQLRGAARAVVDLGCGPGVLLPALARQFGRVVGVDFAPGMLERARERVAGLANVGFLQADLAELGESPPAGLAGTFDVAVAVNSLILPDLGRLEQALAGVHALLKPGGRFLGVVPSIDGVHYHTMLLLDRARRSGMPPEMARRNAAQHGEHHLFDFTFGTFRYQGLDQHFWQGFEVPYRLARAGFRLLRQEKVELPWNQFACGADLGEFAPPWDWFFEAQR